MAFSQFLFSKTSPRFSLFKNHRKNNQPHKKKAKKKKKKKKKKPFFKTDMSFESFLLRNSIKFIQREINKNYPERNQSIELSKEKSQHQLIQIWSNEAEKSFTKKKKKKKKVFNKLSSKLCRLLMFF